MTSEKKQNNQLKWRLNPGYLIERGSDLESTLIFFGRFLADRSSQDPLDRKSVV